MNDTDRDMQKLRALIDAVEADILNASDEEILEDVRSAGEDPEQVAAHMKCCVRSGLVRLSTPATGGRR